MTGEGLDNPPPDGRAEPSALPQIPGDPGAVSPDEVGIAANDAGEASATTVVPPVYSVPPRTSGYAIASLILGIFCCLICLTLYLAPLAVLLGVPALVFGQVAHGRIGRSKGELGGFGIAKAGVILGYVGGGIGVAAFLFYIVAGFGLYFLFKSTTPTSPTSPPPMVSPVPSPSPAAP